MTAVEGLFYDGRSSRSVEARLQVDDMGNVRCEARDGFVLVPPAPLSQIRVSSRLADTPRYLYFNGGEKFETSENTAVDYLQQMHGGRDGLRWVSVIEQRWRYVLISASLVLLFSVWMVLHGVPLTAKWIARSLPAEASQIISRGTLEMLDKSVFSPSELAEERQQALRQHFSGLIALYPQVSHRVEFRKGNAVGANALALPSGTIVFTDELVELADSDDQLLAVMAHELGHLKEQHALRRVVQSSMLALAVASISGDVNAASSVLVAAPTLLMELSYSRDFEREADKFAFNSMLALGVDPVNFADVIAKLEASHSQGEGEDSGEVGNWSDYLSTHPPSHERISRFSKSP